MLFINNFSNDATSDYSMIIVSIRDEQFDRPTEPVHAWPSNAAIIGGIDATEGLHSGTWFAINREKNQIAATLNVIEPLDRLSKCSGKYTRGFLASNFLHGSQRAVEYCNNVLNRERFDYSPFNFITAELDVAGSGVNHVSYCSNFLPLTLTTSRASVHCFANDTPPKLWQKTIAARETFAQITNSELNRLSLKSHLISQLFNLVSCEQKFFPDDNLLECSRGYDAEYVEGLSSVFVRIPPNFGTRTQTIVLIDKQYNCEWIERNFTVEHLSVSGNNNVPLEEIPLIRFNFQFSRTKRQHVQTSSPLLPLARL